MITVEIDQHTENSISEEEAVLLVEVPQSITKLQAMRVMKSSGIWEAFNTFLSSDIDAKDEWELSPVLLRDSKFIEDGQIAMKLTGNQLDQMFIVGGTL